MSLVLNVSRSGYYAWRSTGTFPGKRKQKRDDRDVKVKAACDASKQRDGARRIQAQLAEDGEQADVKTIADSMRRQNLVPKDARKFKVSTNSDRGSQHCSHAYRDLITAHDLQLSMSRKGNCWDNACAESFFHSLKIEAVQYELIMDRDTIRQAVFEYIEVDYNRTRRHSALGYISPENYELKNAA